MKRGGISDERNLSTDSRRGIERVKGNISGLTSEQVKSSREKCGWNELAEGKKKNILQIFLEQYRR